MAYHLFIRISDALPNEIKSKCGVSKTDSGDDQQHVNLGFVRNNLKAGIWGSDSYTREVAEWL
jgi:hypothetical protein